jgi:hypothetical protein
MIHADVDERMDKDISGMLAAYREGSIDLSKLKSWLEAEKSRIEAQLPRGQLLKLRHGNDYARMAAIGKLLPSCMTCASVGESRQFTSRQEYDQYSRRRDASVAAGTLRVIQPPAWTKDGPQAANAVMYYQCSTCGAVWVFGEPERADNGFWTRLA